MLVRFENWFLPADKIKWIKVKKTLFGYYRIVVKCGWRRYRGVKWVNEYYVSGKATDLAEQINKAKIDS